MDIEESQFFINKVHIINTLKSAVKTKYYNNLFKKIGLNIDNIITYKDFKKIPITEKEDYRANQIDFICNEILSKIDKSLLKFPENVKVYNEVQEKNIIVHFTSGSTGKPMLIFKHRSDVMNNYMHLNKYRDKIASRIIEERFIWIWPINSFFRDKYFYIKRNYRELKNGHQYFLNEFSDENFLELYNLMKKYDFRWLISAPSALVHFIKFLAKNRLFNRFNIKYIECQSESLFEWQKDIISKYFGVVPISIYSSNEINFIAGTCPFNRFHIFQKNVFVEIIKNKHDIGEVVLTTLNCRNIPLIRYRLGDCAKWEITECKCNEGTPSLRLEIFRSNDMVKTSNNTLIDPWIFSDSIFLAMQKFNVHFEQFQVRQTNFNEFKYVFYSYKNDKITNVLKCLYTFFSDYLKYILKHDVKVQIEFTTILIPNDIKSNKFKYFICEI